jgi:exopolysaccharide production protein ExoQ
LVLAGVIVIMPMIATKDLLIEEATHISTTVFKKDATLTGRTYLWRQADRLISQRPVVGHGYRSVWLGQSFETTGLLRWAGLSSGKGFNFHNTYKEVTVDTGFLGLALFTFSFGLMGFLSFARFLSDGALAAAFFFSTYLTYAAKAFTELIISPFGTPTLLLFAIACYAVLHRAPKAAPAPQ